MRKFVKQTRFMKKLYLKNKFEKIRVFLSLPCLLYQISSRLNESRLITTLFSCTNFVFRASSLKNQKSCLPTQNCCTAQTCSQRSRFSRDCSHKYLLRACQLTRIYLFSSTFFPSSVRNGPHAFLALVSG